MTQKSNLESALDRVLDSVDAAIEDLPQDLVGAVNDLAEACATQRLSWWKKFFYKNGEFSKTAVGVTVANFITLAWFAVSPFAGAELDLGFTRVVLQPLDPMLSLGVTGVLNGAYLVNNSIKKNSGPQTHG